MRGSVRYWGQVRGGRVGERDEVVAGFIYKHMICCLPHTASALSFYNVKGKSSGPLLWQLHPCPRQHMQRVADGSVVAALAGIGPMEAHWVNICCQRLYTCRTCEGLLVLYSTSKGWAEYHILGMTLIHHAMEDICQILGDVICKGISEGLWPRWIPVEITPLEVSHYNMIAPRWRKNIHFVGMV